jgi:hypothetical protein
MKSRVVYIGHIQVGRQLGSCGQVAAVVEEKEEEEEHKRGNTGEWRGRIGEKGVILVLAQLNQPRT